MQPKSDSRNVEDSGFQPDMMPLAESKLGSFTLAGPLGDGSEYDLDRVLTVYALNLWSLEVDRIHTVNAQDEQLWHGLRFLKVVMDAIG